MTNAPTSPSLTLNQRELADLFGVSPKTIQEWDREGLRQAARLGMKGREAKYDATAALRWWHEKETAALQSRLDDVSGAIDRAKLERAQLEVRKRQVEVAKAEGRAIDIDDHDEVVSKLIEAFRLAALSLPGTWGARIVGVTDPAEGTEAMRLVAEDLLRAMQSKADDLELEAGSAPTPLPEDFPGYRALVAAGIETFDELRMLGDPKSVKGIGPKTAERIDEELEDAA